MAVVGLLSLSGVMLYGIREIMITLIVFVASGVLLSHVLRFLFTEPFVGGFFVMAAVCLLMIRCMSGNKTMEFPESVKREAEERSSERSERSSKGRFRRSRSLGAERRRSPRSRTPTSCVCLED